MKYMREILAKKLKGIASLQHMLRYQEYLALGDEVCVALSFQEYYNIKYGSWLKEWDEDYLKGKRYKLKIDEHERLEKGVHIEKELTVALVAPLETSHEDYDNNTHVR